MLTLYIRHTSASLLIHENYDPTVQTDLERFLSRLVPEDGPIYEHIPVTEGGPMLGAWKGIYVFEHRRAVQLRSVVLHLSIIWGSRAAVAYSRNSSSEFCFAAL